MFASFPPRTRRSPALFRGTGLGAPESLLNMNGQPIRSEVSIGGLTLDQLNRREIEAPDYPDERMYLVDCGTCGQSFDSRYLGDTLYHQTIADHVPLAGSPGFEWVSVDKPEERLFRWR
jgi:hypothetical protein